MLSSFGWFTTFSICTYKFVTAQRFTNLTSNLCSKLRMTGAEMLQNLENSDFEKHLSKSRSIFWSREICFQFFLLLFENAPKNRIFFLILPLETQKTSDFPFENAPRNHNFSWFSHQNIVHFGIFQLLFTKAPRNQT